MGGLWKEWLAVAYRYPLKRWKNTATTCTSGRDGTWVGQLVKASVIEIHSQGVCYFFPGKNTRPAPEHELNVISARLNPYCGIENSNPTQDISA
jgi:hypothetical protein